MEDMEKWAASTIQAKVIMRKWRNHQMETEKLKEIKDLIYKVGEDYKKLMQQEQELIDKINDMTTENLDISMDNTSLVYKTPKEKETMANILYDSKFMELDSQCCTDIVDLYVEIDRWLLHTEKEERRKYVLDEMRNED